MDILYYILLTILIIILSLIIFIILVITHILIKKPFNFISYIILILSITGMYLFIPAMYAYTGYSSQNLEILQKSINLSINPYEKRIVYLFMADIYEYDLLHENKKDGNKAIEFLEKSIQKEYNKYPLETTRLLLLYSIKGDYQKTQKLCEILNKKKGIALLNIYIKNNEYDKALTTFKEGRKCNTYLFLKADLLKEVGKLEESKQTKKEAERIYKSQIESYSDKQKKFDFVEKSKKYSSISAYKIG